MECFFCYANGENRQSLKGQVKPYEEADVSDEGYPDGLILKSAVKELNKLKAQQKPFFLGVGFSNLICLSMPQKNIGICTIDPPFLLPQIRLFHKTFTQIALEKWGSFIIINCQTKSQHSISLVSDGYARKLIHGYYASISYVDHLIGQLLMELKSLELDKNTIVVLWGDHGWHLGNDRKWGETHPF